LGFAEFHTKNMRQMSQMDIFGNATQKYHYFTRKNPTKTPVLAKM